MLERQLKVMDSTAISLCMDNKLPIVVFNLREPATSAPSGTRGWCDKPMSEHGHGDSTVPLPVQLEERWISAI